MYLGVLYNLAGVTDRGSQIGREMMDLQMNGRGDRHVKIDS